MSKIKVYGLRLGIGVLVFLFFKVTSDSLFKWEPPTFVSFGFTLLVVLVVFEILDFSTRHLIKNYKERLTSYKTLLQFCLGNCLVTAPLVVAAAYTHAEVIEPELCEGCNWNETSFASTTAQGLVLSWLIILIKTFLIYLEYSRKSEREKSQLQKELVQSKFESLKDQIKPHFLFNSFSVLSSIIEENPKLAVEFVSKLSKIYRYVLESESQLARLNDELEYMGHYTFLLQTRHVDSLHVKVSIDIDPSEYFIPILTLQMLIENALKHNYFSKEAPLFIEIFNTGKEALTIKNNTHKRIKHEKPTKIGLENISNRYELLIEKPIEVINENGYFLVRLPLVNESDIKNK